VVIPGKRYILTLFRYQKRLVARFVFTSVARSALSMAAILLINEFLAGVLGGAGLAALVAARFGQMASLWVVAVLLVGAYIGASVFNYFNQVAQQQIIKVLELGMMERLVRHLLSLSVPFFDRQSHGDIIQAVRQDVSHLRTVVLGWAKIFLEATVAAGLFVAALQLSPRLTLWALIVLPAAVFPIYWIAKKTLQRSFTVRRTGYVLFDVILQMLRGIRIIKAYRGESEEARTAIEKGRMYFDELVEMVRVHGLATVILESLAGLGIVLVVVVGGVEVMRGSLEWPALLAFLMAIRALHGPLNNVNNAYVDIRRYGAAVERITEVLDARPEVPDRPDALPLPGKPQSIVFQDVGFSYQDRAVLGHVSFEVQAGETIGIAGPSGSGKTTMLNLIARFYDPTSGRVLVNGRDLRDFRLADVYDKLAIVTQEPFLFATTIGDNIRCGRPGASDAEVEEAARAAEIHEDIRAMPEGYDTVVGVGGRGISVGQAQRINIARALLKNAPLLLLDEATSSLDSLSEAKVQRAIDRLMEGRTTFTVAHRLSTLRNASRILVLDGGDLVGSGPHEVLLKTSTLYHRLWETQQMGSPSPELTPMSVVPEEPLQDPLPWEEDKLRE
jgi:subfamily B ATP-binding cassette protein MsbA